MQRSRPLLLPETGATTTEQNGTKMSRHQNTSPVAALRSRRAASRRVVPLDCGCRDAWRPWRPERLSDVQTAGRRRAARHLRDAGFVPLFDLPTLRCMWQGITAWSTTCGACVVSDDIIARGKQIFESGKYAPQPRPRRHSSDVFGTDGMAGVMDAPRNGWTFDGYTSTT